MKRTIESILYQSYSPDIIRINIPNVFKRTGQIYDRIPDFLNHPKIQIKRYNEDFGPIMKILPTFMDYQDNPNANIIFVDDDVLMLPKTIETYVNYMNQQKDYIYCLSGFDYSLQDQWNRSFGKPTFVNIAEGYMSVCLSSAVIQKLKKSVLSMLDYYKFFSMNEFCFTSDDLMLGNFYAMNNTPIFKIHEPDVNFEIWWRHGCELSYGRDGDGIVHMAVDHHNTRYNQAFNYLVENRMNFLLTN